MPRKRPRFGGLLGLGAVGLAAAGCSGSDVSAGAESDAVNMSRCYGADCEAQGLSLDSAAIDAEPCGEVEGALDAAQSFDELAPGAYIMGAVESADGSVWALERVSDSLDVAEPRDTVQLAHFSVDGALLFSRVIFEISNYENVDGALTIDSRGLVTVGIYSIFSVNADADPVEELELSTYDEDFSLHDAPKRFAGVASPHLFGGPAGSVWLAGNADAGASHGVLSRLTRHEPDWIQTNVPSSGQGVLGVSGLTVASDGTAAVLGTLSRRSNGGLDVQKLGVSTFDDEGRPQWTLQLPADYSGGYVPSLVGTAAGDLLVVGLIDGGRSALVSRVSREGELNGAYSFESTKGNRFQVGRGSGRALFNSLYGLAVIDFDSGSCRRFSVLLASGAAPTSAEPWRADRDYLLSTRGGLSRYRVPE